MSFKGLFILLILTLSVGGQAVRAHSFDVAIVADADTMADALAGFRVATRERDGHANEESDGHLGGLDVYMQPVEVGDDLDAVLAQAGTADIVFLALGEGVQHLFLWSELGDSGPAVVRAGLPPGGANWAAEQGAASFKARFEAEFGRSASMAAAQGYIAARRIELAVRPQGGVDDRQALSVALAASDAGLDW